MVEAALAEGIVARAVTRGLVDICVHDLRDFTADRHRVAAGVPLGARPGLAEGMVAAAVTRGLVDIGVHDLRDFTTDRHRVVDDVPFGGGPGMVLKPEPLFAAVEAN